MSDMVAAVEPPLLCSFSVVSFFVCVCVLSLSLRAFLCAGDADHVSVQKHTRTSESSCSLCLPLTFTHSLTPSLNWCVMWCWEIADESHESARKRLQKDVDVKEMLA